MSRGTRVQLARGYVLQQRPYRDSSLIAEAWTREYGRLTLFARAARGPRSRFAALQPFCPLLLSWSGRGEAAQLTGAERTPGVADRPTAGARLPPQRLLSGFYLNELLLKLTARHDPNPQLFDQYEHTLGELAQNALADVPLRQFELRLLRWIGYGLALDTEADTGLAVEPLACYRFGAGIHGVVRESPHASAEAADQPRVAGHVLLRLAHGEPLETEVERRQARRLLRAALEHCLEGRELATRKVARSLAHYARRESTY